MTYAYTSDGKKISLLGYGAMRIPTTDGGNANRVIPGVSTQVIDQEQFNRQVKVMLDAGLNYFDTSPVYCQGKSEESLGQALAASGYPREDYVIATKLSNFSPLHYPLSACKEMFESSLRYLRTDYIDNYLLHAVGMGGKTIFSKRYLENGALDWCCELRAQKRIRNLGFSFHGDEAVFDWCLEHHEKYHWDFCQIQMNYVDWRHAKETNPRNLDAEMMYRKLTELKIPVVIMEPLLGGRLARYNWAIANELKPLDPEASLAKWALRFCGSFKNVLTVLSGMTLSTHIEENLATFSPLKPLSETEFDALERAARAMLNLNTVPCNACNYCMPCPYGLDIPTLLTFRNRMRIGKHSPQQVLAFYEKALPEPLRRADHCTGCGRCEPHCPQMIKVSEEIAAVDAWIDELKTEAAK